MRASETWRKQVLDGHRLGGVRHPREPAIPSSTHATAPDRLTQPRREHLAHMIKLLSAGENAMPGTQSFDRELDVRGLNCPLPILRAKKVLGDLHAGQVLKVMATDPGSVKDFQAFCKQTGNELLSHSEGPEFTFFMKKR